MWAAIKETVLKVLAELKGATRRLEAPTTPNRASLCTKGAIVHWWCRRWTHGRWTHGLMGRRAPSHNSMGVGRERHTPL